MASKLPEGAVSIKEYARMVKCSDMSVIKAIGKGYIRDGVIKNKQGGNMGIYPLKATEEWEEHRNPNYENRRPAPPSDLSPPPPTSPGASDDKSLAAIKKYDALYKAKTTEMTYRKKMGELVEKKKEYAELYSKGQEIRNSLLAMPDRIIDSLLACPTRNDSHTLFVEEMSKLLENMANVLGNGEIETIN